MSVGKIYSAKFLIGHLTFFTLILKVRAGLTKIHDSINKPKLFLDSAGNFI